MRARALTVVVGLLLGAAVSGMVGAVPAAALATCPAGYSPVGTAGGVIECMNLRGDVRGYIDSSGAYQSGVAETADPQPVTQPSSVLSAEAGSTATDAEAAQLAAADGTAGDVVLSAEATGADMGPAGLLVATAGIGGFEFGSEVAGWACGWGLTWECGANDAPAATPASDFEPNVDVSYAPQGWTPARNFWSVSFNATNGAGAPYQVSAVESAQISFASYTAPGTVQPVVDVSGTCTAASTGSPGVECGASSVKSYLELYYIVQSPGPGTKTYALVGAAKVGVTPTVSATANNQSVGLGANVACSGCSGGQTATSTGTYAGGTVVGAVAIADTAGLSCYQCTTTFTVGSGRPIAAPACLTGLPNGSTIAGLGSGQMGWYCASDLAGSPPAVQADPPRQWRAVNECVDPGGTETDETADSATFTEGSAPSSWPAFPTAPACPAGTTLTGSKVLEISSGLADKTIWDFTVPDPIKTWQATYPQCSDGSCRLGLWKAAGADWLNCFDNAVDCSAWFSDPSKATDYSCTYGTGGDTTFSPGQVVDLSECNVYSPTFDPAKKAAGTPYGNPGTGSVPAPSKTGTDPGGSGTPAPGGGDSSCWPSGWGVFNPLDWILQPVKCALAWAFEPSSSSLTDFETTVKSAYDSTAIGEWAGVIGGIGSFTAPADGCGGATLHIPQLGDIDAGDTDVTVFSTCEEPWHTASIAVKSLLIVVICWFTAIGVFRNIAAAFGYDAKVAA